MATALAEAGMPMVVVDDVERLPFDSVNLDNFAGISVVVNHLHALGHRRIAFLGELTNEPNTDYELRKEAFETATHRLGIEKQCTVSAHPAVDRLVERQGPYCQEDGYQGSIGSWRKIATSPRSAVTTIWWRWGR